MKAYLKLTKFGIVIFTLLSALAGYGVSFRQFQKLIWAEPVLLMIGLFLVCSGSFAVNQAQEWRRDDLMDRTKSRPIPSGMIKPWQAWAIGFVLLALGLYVLSVVSVFTAYLSFATVVMYNITYTMFFKRDFVFGAVPGAIPGAMPVVIGYSVNSPNIFTPECIYLFLIMFLWQMPHFWAIAIKFKKDYEQGGFPVLPTKIGDEETLYHIGLYMFVYVGLALVSPWFLQTNVLYILLVVPVAVKILYEFFKYFRSKGKESWLPFFLWTNLSMLIFLGAPVFDRWLYNYLQ